MLPDRSTAFGVSVCRPCECNLQTKAPDSPSTVPTDPRYAVRFVMLTLDQDMKTKKVKIKVTLVQALRLCTGRTADRGSRGIALLFHDQRH